MSGLPRYIALLRGVSPMNAKMPELRRCFERAGFTDVQTLLSSGNVAFSARAASPAALERKAEAAMASALRQLLESDPFRAFRLPAKAKRVVPLPIELEGARVLAVKGSEVFTAYVPGPRGPVFMALIEKTFGRDVTTRTWDTVRKCAEA